LEFTNVEDVEGDYTVEIDGLSGSFKIKAPPPTESNISLSNLLVSPSEAWVGEPISATVTAKNGGPEADSLLVKLMLDEVFIDSKIVQLGAGETTTVEFIFNATSEGKHKIKVNTLIKSLNIVPYGMHTLRVFVSPDPGEEGANFTLNGETVTAPYYGILSEGEYVMAMEPATPDGESAFLNWGDGSKNPIKRISLTSAMLFVAYYELGASCPSLFIWNGTDYVYVQEVSNHGWLGYTRYIHENGSLEYWKNNPWDYIPIDKNQLQLTDGYYRMNLTQRWNEIFFLDAAYLMVVDHPSDMNVYSTMVEQYINPNYMGQIYTVSKNPLTPVSAFNELVTVFNGVVIDFYNKVDALPAISKIDGVLTTGFNGKYSQDWNNQTWNRLTLDLGDLSGESHIKLLVNAMVDWGPADSYVLWMNKFYSMQVPNYTEPTPIPFMEVKDADGNWVRVSESRQFPLPPDRLPQSSFVRTFVVDLTGLFPTNDYSLRINNFWNVTFDFIGVDTSTQKDLTIRRIDPIANLRQEFDSPSDSSGNFTRYGDVTRLLLTEDDKFVIGRQGDSVSLLFPASNLEPPAPGIERDFFLFVACWFKVEYANYGFGRGFGFTVDPLPFHNMSGFPYPLDKESYPYDAEHLRYLQEYNTRVIKAPSQPKPQESSLTIWVTAVIILVTVVDLCVLVYFKKRSRVLST
jgi:hypothetical protein